MFHWVISHFLPTKHIINYQNILFFFYLIEEIRLIQPLQKFEESELLQKSIH